MIHGNKIIRAVSEPNPSSNFPQSQSIGLSSTSQARNPALVTSKAIGIEKAIVESSNTFVGEPILVSPQKLDGSTIYGLSLWLLVTGDTGVLLWGKE